MGFGKYGSQYEEVAEPIGGRGRFPSSAGWPGKKKGLSQTYGTAPFYSGSVSENADIPHFHKVHKGIITSGHQDPRLTPISLCEYRQIEYKGRIT